MRSRQRRRGNGQRTPWGLSFRSPRPSLEPRRRVNVRRVTLCEMNVRGVTRGAQRATATHPHLLVVDLHHRDLDLELDARRLVRADPSEHLCARERDDALVGAEADDRVRLARAGLMAVRGGARAVGRRLMAVRGPARSVGQARPRATRGGAVMPRRRTEAGAAVRASRGYGQRGRAPAPRHTDRLAERVWQAGPDMHPLAPVFRLATIKRHSFCMTPTPLSETVRARGRPSDTPPRRA